MIMLGGCNPNIDKHKMEPALLVEKPMDLLTAALDVLHINRHTEVEQLRMEMCRQVDPDS